MRACLNLFIKRLSINTRVKIKFNNYALMSKITLNTDLYNMSHSKNSSTRIVDVPLQKIFSEHTQLYNHFLYEICFHFLDNHRIGIFCTDCLMNDTKNKAYLLDMVQPHQKLHCKQTIDLLRK